MAITTAEARERILDDLATAVDQVALAIACLGEAFEQLAVGTADRLEVELFRPVQKAYARGQRSHAGFAERTGMPGRQFELPSAGPTSQGAKDLVERAAAAAAAADRIIAALQDSLLPLESGDPQLRSELSEVRELLAGITANARDFLRALGR
jgi:hypothetical protein